MLETSINTVRNYTLKGILRQFLLLQYIGIGKFYGLTKVVKANRLNEL